MAELKAGKRTAEPLHPGRIVSSSLDELRMSGRAAAERIGVSAGTLNNVMLGTSAISPDMALRLGTFFGNGAEVWLNMQSDYDLWHAEARLRSELRKIKPAVEAA